LRGTDAEHNSVLSGTEQHHQANQYCQPQELAHWKSPLSMSTSLLPRTIFLFEKLRRPWQLESQLATRNKFHLIIATELRRYFTDAGRELPSEFMRSLLSDHSWYALM
jgi:hypothetical protein